MKIENLKDLTKVVQLCRKHGVTAIEIDGIKMNILEPTPPNKTFSIANDIPEANIKVPQYNGVIPAKAIADKIATDELTEEQILFYSARPEAPQDETQQ